MGSKWPRGLYLIEENLTKLDYLDKPKQHIPATVTILNLPSDIILAYHPKQTAIVIKEWLLHNVKKELFSRAWILIL